MDDHFEQYYLKAVHFLKFRQRSVKEMREYLKKKNASDEVIDRVIAMLSEQKFLNDREFARAWIENRARFRPKGRRIVELELKQKGISKDIIGEVMAEEPTEDVPDETEQLRRLVEQRLPKYKHLERFEVYQKLGAFLARRGYTWDHIKRAIDAVYEKEYN
jgi:regulatory protein